MKHDDEFLEECTSRVKELISKHPFCFAELKHIVAYDKEGKLIEEAKQFAIDKMVPDAGYLYMPIEEGDTVLVIRSSKKESKDKPGIKEKNR